MKILIKKKIKKRKSKKATLMKLMYFPQEKTVLLIPDGYVDNENVDNLVKTLQEYSEKLTKICSPGTRNIYSRVVENSRRYKHMRIFYAKEVDTAPENAFVVSGDWTMHKWISD